MVETMAVILAGGRGKRMDLLCYLRPKPVLPFAGKLRVIDFSLSNCVHSQIKSTAVLVDYQRNYMTEYLKEWRAANPGTTEINVLPPEAGPYLGTADAVYRNIAHINRSTARHVLILAGDHVYRMDYRRMRDFHTQVNADVTVGVVRIPLNEAHRFGTVNIDNSDRIIKFVEKSTNPLSPLASMGIYIFNQDILDRCLEEDANDADSRHDFGYSILPGLVKKARVFAYEFSDYWQDIGTIEAYYHANMGLLSASPRFKLDSNWPLLSNFNSLPQPITGPDSHVENSIISPGCIIRGRVIHSILSPGVIVKEKAIVKDSVIMGHTQVGFHSVIDTSIIDEGAQIGKFCYIGFGKSALNSERGITVVGKDVSMPDHTAVGIRCKVLPMVSMTKFAGKMVSPGKVVGSSSLS